MAIEMVAKIKWPFFNTLDVFYFKKIALMIGLRLSNYDQNLNQSIKNLGH
jgi:hypothetical protein